MSEQRALVSVIANPLATEKVIKHAVKLVKPIVKEAKKNTFALGVKNVNKAVRKKTIKEGYDLIIRYFLLFHYLNKISCISSCLSTYLCRILFIGGDITPIDLITHLPVLCEENNIVYVFMPTSESINKVLVHCTWH